MKIFVDIKHLDNELICIGMLTEKGHKFYAESSQFSKEYPSDFIPCFSPPDIGEDEHWMWNKNKNFEMRGPNSEIAIHIKDWLQSILDGALSWVDYSEESGGPGYRHIRPNIDLSDYTLFFKTLDVCDIYNNLFEKRLNTIDISLDQWNIERKYDFYDFDHFVSLYHSNTPKRVTSSCEVIKSYVNSFHANVKTVEKL